MRFFSWISAARGAGLALLPIALSAQAVDFANQVRPILEQQCVSCHGAEKGLGALRLHTRAAALQGGTKGPAVVPGKPEQSRLLTSMELTPDKAGAMPPGGPQVPAEQRAVIRQWIAAGAEWSAGVTLGAGQAVTRKGADDEALAEQMHKRITQNPTERTAADMKPYATTIPGTTVAFDMLPIPAGAYNMGTPDGEEGHRKSESPPHQVRIEPFWMGKHEVTWDEYRLFMFAQQAGETTQKDAVVDAISRPTRPYVEMSFGMGINGFPAISMTQHAANKYAQWLSAKTGQFYRLPTEAEWEYACRAGTTTAYSFGDDAAKLGEYAWFVDNSGEKYQKVGQKKPNPWGLHDMHGNVMEWTLDQYSTDFYAASKGQASPWNKATKPYPHAVRGGAWTDDAAQLRCGARVGSDPTWKQQDPQLPKSIWYHTDAQGLGFRLVRPLAVPTATQMFQYWNNGVYQEQ